MGFRTRITGLAGAAAAPWMLLLALSVADAGLALPAASVLAMLVSLAALAAIHRLLAPLAPAAETIRAAVAEAGGTVDGDDPTALLAGAATLRDKLSRLQHRWSQRHPLTDFPTRELLLAEMGRDMAAAPGETLLGVIRFRDFDRLQAFDADKADEALQAFSELLSAAVSKKRPLAQVDRDSFAIWFRGATPEAAETELRALCYALGSEIRAGDLALTPEVDAGAGLYPKDGRDPAGLLNRTLLSLDKKQRGGGKLRLLTPRAAQAAREDFSLEQGLRQAVARDELELHFQPVVDLARCRLAGAEALIRWRHGEAGLISPQRFVPILEDADLTEEIGRWTLNAACRAAASGRAAGAEGLTVAVNLSARPLKDPRLVKVIERTLERHQLPPRTLELELTETAAMEDKDHTFELFSTLRDMGVSLAIDDFGSGYSSLSYVKNLPFDKLKIDREFVVEVDRRRDSAAICRALIALARGLGIGILAERVERREEAALLRAMGCALFQGFLFSPPLSETDFAAKIGDRDWLEAIAATLEGDVTEGGERMSA